MPIRGLRVLNQLKTAGQSPEVVGAAFGDDVFFLETCQRRIWVGTESSSLSGEVAFDEAAYLELLLVACGLESQILGETDVFGQLKDAWRFYESAEPEAARRLALVFHKLFEDVKEIRSRYLEGLGGTSYGSLARRLIAPQPTDRVLVIGAGRISQSVAPFFVESPITIINRSGATADALAESLKTQGARDVTVVRGAAAEEAAWAQATHAVVGVPIAPDSAVDGARVRAWRRGETGRTGRGLVLHLGCLARAEAGAWKELAELRTLSELFEIRTTQDGARELAGAAAKRACRERARLRGLGGGLSVAHGWEDLAAFF